MEKRLLRSNRDRMIAGVCSGLADYLNVDPTLVRIVFIVLTLVTGGLFGIVYLLLWVVTPEAGRSIPTPPTVPPSSAIVPTGEPTPVEPGAAPLASDTAATPGTAAPSAPSRPRDLRIVGWIALAIGVYLLLGQLGIGHWVRSLWPLALVVVGVMMLWPYIRRRR